jgi:hypothetical protein
METLGTVRLTSEVDPQRAVAVSVPRDEITTILLDPEAEPELQLEFRGDEEQSRITMAWSRNELEDLLGRATGDPVVITFDRDELADAFADVEAHGVRQKALVFTVAATSALGIGAGIANARELADVGGGSAVSVVTPPASYGVRPNPDLGAQVSRGAELAAPSSSGEVFGVQKPDATDTILVGGALLAIAGATFAARRTRPTRPA